MKKNVEFLKKCRADVGPDFPIMVDCYMSLNVHYAVQLAQKCIDEGINIKWWEEVLNPDDVAGHKLLKERMPTTTWTTGEHEYNRYGCRELIKDRAVDILQADVMWVGGLTELMKVNSLCMAHDIPLVPHGSGPYSYHVSSRVVEGHFPRASCLLTTRSDAGRSRPS